MSLISQKYQNYEYAPGVATYGVNGKSGTSGKNGTSVFVCQYDITEDDGKSKFGTAIRQNQNMTSGTAEKLGRPYMNGDCFLFPNCNIYKIIDIDELKRASISNQLSSIIDDCMELVGSITISQSTNGFSSEQNRLVLNTTNYKGFVINVAGVGSEYISNSPFTIISNDADSDGKIHFINMKSIYSGTADSELSIYYDSDNDAYHLESERPIVMNADVKIYTSQSDDFDEYSSVLLEDNSITSWHGICDNISFYVQDDTEDENKIIIKFVNSNNDDSEIVDKFVHICLKDENTFELLREWYIKISSDYGSSFEDKEFHLDLSDLDVDRDSVINMMLVSLIGPVEIYVQQN